MRKNKGYILTLSIIAILFVAGLVYTTNLTAQSGRSKKVTTTFSGAGVSYGGYISNIDSVLTTPCVTDMIDVSWIKGKTIHTFLALTSPAAANGDTGRVVFEGAIQLGTGTGYTDWFPIDSISTILSAQTQTYRLYVNSWAGRFDYVRIKFVNTTTATNPYTNRSGKTLDWFITADGTNFPNYYTGGMWH